MVEIVGNRGETDFPLPLISPWISAALVASVAPVILLLVHLAVPQVRPLLSFGSEREFYLPGFGGIEPLHGASWSFAWATGIVYWLTGHCLTVRSNPPACHGRKIVSRLLVTISIAVLLFAVPMVANVWTLAAKSGVVPDGLLGLHEGNHGPWRHVYPLRKLLMITMFLPVFACVAAIFSWIADPTRTARRAFLVCLGSLAILWGTHYGLVG